MANKKAKIVFTTEMISRFTSPNKKNEIYLEMEVSQGEGMSEKFVGSIRKVKKEKIKLGK